MKCVYLIDTKIEPDMTKDPPGRTWHIIFWEDTRKGSDMRTESAFCGAVATDSAWGAVTHSRPGWPHNLNICEKCEAEYQRLLARGAFRNP